MSLARYVAHYLEPGTPAPGTALTPIVEWSPTTAPLAATPVWVDITPYLRSWQTQWGRQNTIQRFETGTMTLELTNADRRFEPYFASGAYHPNVVPRKRIRLRLTDGVTVWPWFDGYVESWSPSYPASGMDAVCKLECVDLGGLLAEWTLATPYVREVLADSPTAYYRFAETAGVTAVDSSGNGRDAAYTATGITYSQTDPITDDADQAILLDGSTGYVLLPSPAIPDTASAFSIEVWFRTANTTAYLFTAEGLPGTYFRFFVTASGFVGVDGDGSGLGHLIDTSPTAFNDDAWHQAVFTFDGTTGELSVDGVSYGTSAFSFAAAWGSAGFGNVYGIAGFNAVTIDEASIYATELSSTRVAAHYAARNSGLGDLTSERVTAIAGWAGIPTTLRDIHSGLSSMTSAGNLASQKALEALRDAEATEAGALFVSRDGKLTFRSRKAPLGASTASTTSQVTYGTGGGQTAWCDIAFLSDVVDVANVVANSGRNTVTSVVRDASSITKYGEKSVSLQTAPADAAEVTSRAQWELGHLKDPTQLRVKSMAFRVTSDNAGAVLGREIWDRVTISWTPPGGGAGISQEALVQGASASGVPGHPVDVTLDVSSAPLRSYWRLGVSGFSNLGSSTRLAF